MTPKKPEKPQKVTARDIFMPKGIDKTLLDSDRDKKDEHHNDSDMGKSNRIVANLGDKRISVYITEDNLAFLEKYQSIYRIPKASKASELLNRAIEKMRKESN